MQATHEPAKRTPRIMGFVGAEKSQVARSDYWDRAMQQAHKIGASKRKSRSVSAWARLCKKAITGA